MHFEYEMTKCQMGRSTNRLQVGKCRYNEILISETVRLSPSLLPSHEMLSSSSGREGLSHVKASLVLSSTRGPVNH